MRCICCKNETYLLKNGYRKCKVCKKKFSPKRLKNIQKIYHLFCLNKPALTTANLLSLHYITIQSYYQKFRQEIARYMEKEFHQKKSIAAFDEYIYLQQSKQKDKRDIFNGFNFITFEFDEKIYNLLLPDLSIYKPKFLEDELESIYYKEFERFLKRTHISKNKKSNIEAFWSYLERFLKKYRGFQRENFFYYLKEAEFKYNFECETIKEIYENTLCTK